MRDPTKDMDLNKFMILLKEEFQKDIDDLIVEEYLSWSKNERN